MPQLITDVDGMRITAFATGTKADGPGTQLADLELRQRRRARCEDRIRVSKDTGLMNLPSSGSTRTGSNVATTTAVAHSRRPPVPATVTPGPARPRPQGSRPATRWWWWAPVASRRSPPLPTGTAQLTSSPPTRCPRRHRDTDGRDRRRVQRSHRGVRPRGSTWSARSAARTNDVDGDEPRPTLTPRGRARPPTSRYASERSSEQSPSQHRPAVTRWSGRRAGPDAASAMTDPNGSRRS